MFTGLKTVIFGMRDGGLPGDVLAPAMVLVHAMQETQIRSLGWEDPPGDEQEYACLLKLGRGETQPF